MEHVNCVLCEIDDAHCLVRKNAFHVVRCNQCGLVYVSPRMDERELANLYNASEDSGVERITISQADPGHDTQKIRKFRIAMNLLKKRKNNIKKVLDVGCSTGIFLGLVAEAGWIPFGCDVSRKLVEKNRKKYGENIKLQVGQGIAFPDQHFDVVTLFDSIEHMPDPIAALEEAKRVTKDDGLIVISTPNIDGLFPRVTYQLFGKTIGAWEHPTPPGHVYQFSKKTLKNTLEKAHLRWVDFSNFEIYKPYTVGSLENAIIDAVRNKPDRTSHIDRTSDQKENGAIHQWPVPASQSSMSALSYVKKLPRLIVRGCCWSIVALIYPLARLLHSGDSMVVIAEKSH